MDVTLTAAAGISAQLAQTQSQIALAGLRNAVQADQQIASVLSEVILEGGSTTSTRGNNVNISV